MKPVICLSVICFTVIFWMSLVVYFAPTERDVGMTQAEIDYVIKELKSRSVGNCQLTRTDYGYVCKEMATNKIYRIKM